MKRAALLAATTSFCMIFSGLSAVRADEGDAKALILKKCSICHTPNRALDKAEDKAYWEETVKRMQQKLPDSISDADVKAIVQYLSTNNVRK